jgi:hypothetical protein
VKLRACSRKVALAGLGRESHQLHFVALEDNRVDRLRVRGAVKYVRPGDSFIAVPGFPDFFCPGSRYGNIPMRKGLEVEFTPGFTAKGTQALDLEIIGPEAS